MHFSEYCENNWRFMAYYVRTAVSPTTHWFATAKMLANRGLFETNASFLFTGIEIEIFTSSRQLVLFHLEKHSRLRSWVHPSFNFSNYTYISKSILFQNNFSAQHHLMKTIELSRVNLFNVITQFKATFADDESTIDNNGFGDFGNIFQAWINKKVKDFLTILETDLNRNEITSYDTILGQCMYFGLSFSRIGADFRALIVPIFIKVIAQSFNARISKLTEQFELDMDNYTFINKVSINVLNAIGKIDPNSLSPPETLLNFQPLALYCNGLLSALNEFRNCAPIALVNEITVRLQVSLKAVANNIAKFYRQEKQALGVKERDSFVKFCCAFAFDLIPYIQRCIHDVFQVKKLTNHMSINAIILQKNGVSYLHKKTILEPLDHLLPDKIDTIVK